MNPIEHNRSHYNLRSLSYMFPYINFAIYHEVYFTFNLFYTPINLIYETNKISNI